MPNDIASLLQKAFIEFKDFHNLQTPVDGFVASDDRRYNVIRAIA